MKNFREALTNAPDGTYIYHEKDVYVPYRINHGHITFNRGDAMEIKSIKTQLNQNRSIGTNAYNKLVWKQYESMWKIRKSIFMEPLDGTYRREFIINYARTIPHQIWI